MPAWSWLIISVAIAVHIVAGLTTQLTIGAMRSVSDFANTVHAIDASAVVYYNLVSFPAVTAASLYYVWPVMAFFRIGAPRPASRLVQRRALSAPLVLALLSFAPWTVSLVLFPALTIYRFGHWSAELMSQQILSPLVNGFLASATSYFLLDLIFRARVIPRVFSTGDLIAVARATSLGLTTRLLVFLAAVAFLPLFTMLGLARGAGNRLLAGVSQAEVVELLNHASSITFVVYVGLGILLTAVLSRSLTRPLGDVARALGRVQSGDLDVEMYPTANDEVGVVEDGVNRMVAALRDRERILQTFGRVVEPAVRDHLLRGDLQRGGELRHASVLFCDLRGFTALAETGSPHQMVETLNSFFTAMTGRVREAGGFVDKFIGDALLVIFGLFDQQPGTAQIAGADAAVRCAAAMRSELEALNRHRSRLGLPALRIAGSIHTGEVVAGTIGASDRHEFTVVGDTVNVAARLQETCKAMGWQFLISEATLERARQAGVAVEPTEDAAVAIRGRNQDVRVFRLS